MTNSRLAESWGDSGNANLSPHATGNASSMRQMAGPQNAPHMESRAVSGVLTSVPGMNERPNYQMAYGASNYWTPPAHGAHRPQGTHQKGNPASAPTWSSAGWRAYENPYRTGAFYGSYFPERTYDWASSDFSKSYSSEAAWKTQDASPWTPVYIWNLNREYTTEQLDRDLLYIDFQPEKIISCSDICEGSFLLFYAETWMADALVISLDKTSKCLNCRSSDEKSEMSIRVTVFDAKDETMWQDLPKVAQLRPRLMGRVQDA